LDQPVASLVRAKDMIRELKKEQGGVLMQPVNVYLRGGRHTLDAPFVLEAQDSSHPDAPITYPIKRYSEGRKERRERRIQQVLEDT